MQKHLISGLSTALLLVLHPTLHAAPCGTGAPLNKAQILTLLQGKRVYAVSPGGEDWKEDHCASGELYKVGDPSNSAVDPRALRGSWSVSEDVLSLPGGSLTLGKISYTYTNASSSTTYSFYVIQDGSTYKLCSTGMPPQLVANITNITAGGC